MNKLYGEYAHLWPTLSPPGNYALEARYWERVLRERLGPGRKTLLDLGTGGGHHLVHLAAAFDTVGVDLSPGMLENARRLVPGAELHRGDMRDFRLGRTVDAVIAHDAIPYMRTRDDLRAAFATARAHLRPGGVFVTVPDDLAETFVDPTVRTRTCRVAGGEVTFFEYACDPDPTDERYQTLYVYVLRTGTGAPVVDQDWHHHGLFARATWVALLEEAGFAVEVLRHAGDRAPEGSMFVGTVPG